MTIAAALAEIESSPDLLDHFEHLGQVIKDEQQRREKFLEELDDTKAEFINGQVVVHSPVRLAHLQAGFFATNLLGNYAIWRDLGQVYSEKCLVHCQRNDCEPDICFYQRAKCEGWNKDKLIFPPPDLVVEILSPSTIKYDRGVKLHDYARHQVGEYWIVDADARTVEQHTQPSNNGYKTKALLAGNDLLVSIKVTGFIVSAAAFFDAREYERALRELLGQF